MRHKMRVVVEGRVVEDQLSGCDSRQARIGPLIGTVIKKRAIVLHFVQTPVVEEIRGGGCGLPSENWWIEDHSQQVRDILPGGLSVVGLCLISPSLEPDTLAPLTQLSKQIRGSDESDFLIAHFSPITTKFSCWCLPASKNVVSLVAAEDLSFEELKGSLCHLESEVSIHLDTLVSAVSDPFHEIKRKLVAGLGCWKLATVVVGDKYGHGQQLSDYAPDGQARCLVYPRHKPLSCGKSQPLEEATSALTVSGRVSVIAYVPFEASFAEASKAVTDDVVETVVIRWRRLYEDMKGQKWPLTGRMQLPKRVELAVDGCHFHFSAYLFPDETQKEMCERVSEILGIDTNSLSVVDCEQGSPAVQKLTTKKSVSPLTWKIAAAIPIILALCLYAYWAL